MKTQRFHATVVVLTIFGFHATATVLCVDLNSANPTPPFTNWATAATNIQNAIDAAAPGDTILVTNGIYQTGGRVVYGSLTNRVAVNKPVTVQSVNGPGVTVIGGYRVPSTTYGDAAVRCVYLTNGAALTGFTLTNGATRSTGDNLKEESGGGVWCESVSAVLLNCVLSSNSARVYGGGAYSGTLNNCSLVGNSAGASGGGAASFILATLVGTNCILNNCILTGNSAVGYSTYGGGVFECGLVNCTLNSNSATEGGGAMQSRLDNCTLNGNFATSGGGGISVSLLHNCTLLGNSAPNGGGAFNSSAAHNSGCGLIGCTLISNTATMNGGGGDQCDMTNCLLVGNSASYGGGAEVGILNNCTITGNSGGAGGGAGYCTLNNCILYLNPGTNTDSDHCTNHMCCLTPVSASFSFSSWYGYGGVYIFANPQFVDWTNGDFHLQSNSPCINGGNGLYVGSSTDLDGNPRVVGGAIDIGAYEYQSPQSVLPYWWMQMWGLPTDGSADFIDSDGDGMNNWQEFQTGTFPLIGGSVLKIQPLILAGTSITIKWHAGVSWLNGVPLYYVQRSTNLLAQPAFTTIQSNIPAPAYPNLPTYIDTNAIGPGPYFYRVGLQN